MIGIPISTAISKRAQVGYGGIVQRGSQMLGSVTLEEEVFIGAGAVVTKNVAPGQTDKGNPAR